jgi:hypothetical protein
LVFRAASFRAVKAALVFGALAATANCGKSTTEAPRLEPAGEAGAQAEPSAGGVGGEAGLGGENAGATSGDAMAEAGQAGEGGEAPLAPTLRLHSITISQTHELPLMQEGVVVEEKQRPAPLVAHKRALVRVFVDVEQGFVARPLLGVLDLKTPERTRTLVSRLAIDKSSRQDDLTTTFVFNVDAADLAENSGYRVRVLEADTTPLARFPEADYVPLAAQKLPPFELVVVPFIANGFTPKTGDPELTALRRRLIALYPSTDVEVSLAPAVTLPYVLNGNGDGWDNALDEIYQLRAATLPPPARDVFFYGLMAPSASFASYCQGGGCTLGFSNVAAEDDVDSRGSIGVGVFPDGSGTKDAWDTLAHELGHAMGRDHSPCGVDDPDPDYPYPNAGMGSVYGFDFDAMKLVKPKGLKDVMSYCAPVWISDYTYRGIFERLDYIAQESFRVLELGPAERFRIARIRRDGTSVWLGERARRGSAARRSLELLNAAGKPVTTVQVQVARVDHGPGSYVWLRAQELQQSGAKSVDLRPLGGAVLGL